MFDDQLEAVELLIRAILRDPEGPGLPTVEPPEPGEDPHTGVHTQGSTERTEPEDDPRLHPNFGVTPELLESIGIEVDRMPEMTDYERGWRAGRGAAIHTIEDLRSQAPVHSPTEATLSVALDRVASLEVKGEP
jgi:hypothetical protein